MAENWSTFVEEHGVRIRLYQRSRGGSIYREVRTRDGKDRKSLQTCDRNEAERLAKSLAAKIARARLTGVAPETLTLEELDRIYNKERGPLQSDRRKVEVAKAFRLLREHLGDGFRVADLGQHQMETYEAARRSGTLAATWGSNGGGPVGASTIAGELGVLHAALNWGERFKRGGRSLIVRNPLRGVPLPSEPNPARPVASRERFEALRGVADELDGSGGFRTMLDLAWYTGRRFSSIAALRAGDVLTGDQVARALAEAGREEYLAEAWPAAIRWAAESDKEGVEWIVPIPGVLSTALAAYIRDRGLVGNALLFPARRDPSSPVSKETGYYWMRTAERKAGLHHQRRGGWHAFRRAWATKRKHLPLQDVMAAGGWRDPAALQTAYQHADGETIRAVMDLE